MKTVKKIFKWFMYILLIPVSYLLVSLVLSWITVDQINSASDLNQTIYLSTNGVHLDIVLPKNAIEDELLSGLKHNVYDQYLAFGWGDENFYLNTPTWGDLTFANAFNAVFLKSTSLMHVTRYSNKSVNWVEVKLSQEEFQKLNHYIFNTFKTDQNGQKIWLSHQGYTPEDDFYKAKGSYSFFKTCNSWVNTGFKQSGLKSCVWTPFDFGLLDKYR